MIVAARLGEGCRLSAFKSHDCMQSARSGPSD
ncbi:hypothetical protein A2U01_0118985 [Trifolium medium]|uniref:Uncharacterized protein n=1 Tax=Trifolium medium TaxID=97028 RepID=A0A392WAM2_9FABA|nr:hypothetical protein [Trifolium medium]